MKDKNYKRFCLFQKWLSVFTYSCVCLFIGVGLSEYYFGLDVVAVMAIFQEYAGNILDKFTGGNALDPRNYANFWKWA